MERLILAGCAWLARQHAQGWGHRDITPFVPLQGESLPATCDGEGWWLSELRGQRQHRGHF